MFDEVYEWVITMSTCGPSAGDKLHPAESVNDTLMTSRVAVLYDVTVVMVRSSLVDGVTSLMLGSPGVT